MRGAKKFNGFYNSLEWQPLYLLVLFGALIASFAVADEHRGSPSTLHDVAEGGALPSSGPALTEMGGKRLSQGDVTGALRAFSKATQLFPTVALTWYNLAVAASQGGLLRQAEDAYRTCSEISSDDPDVLVFLMQCTVLPYITLCYFQHIMRYNNHAPLSLYTAQAS